MSPAVMWGLAGLAAVLAATVGLELRPAGRADLPPSAGPSRIPVPLPGAAAALAPGRQQAWVDTILARPLFSPDRRPPASGPAAGPAAPAALPRIAGIMVDGGRRSVIFAGAGTGRPAVVIEGAELNGFRVQAIEPGQVTVVGPDGTRVLRPSFDPNPPAPPPAVVPAGAPGLPGLPSLPGLPNFTGIPGLTAPSSPVPSAR